jgi:hypothetical protein
MPEDDDVIVDIDKLFEAFRVSVVSFITLITKNFKFVEIKCGYLNAKNVDGDTALHILARYAVNDHVDLSTGVHDMAVECIQLLLDSGAHRDVCNNAWETPADILARSDNAAVSNMMANYCPPLQCLAATVAHELNLPLDDLPSRLKAFVLLH